MVPRIVAWTLVGLVVLVLLVVGTKSISSAGTTAKETATSDLGRFQVVRSTPDQIILLDTTSGDLYKAGPEDIQDYKNLKEDDESEPDDSD